MIDGKNFNITINHQEFEDLYKKDFNKCIPIVENALKDANLTKDEIDDIIFVGGSTHIPRIQQIVENYFRKKHKNSINPDEVLVFGVAIQGVIINNFEDFTAFSLGLELEKTKSIKKKTF